MVSVYTGYEGNGPISRALDPMGEPPMSLLQHSVSIFQEAPLKHQEKSNTHLLAHTCNPSPQDTQAGVGPSVQLK